MKTKFHKPKHNRKNETKQKGNVSENQSTFQISK